MPSAPDTHAARRGGSGDAVATARPDILDRNGEMLATDVMTPSLFAEPRRIIDADEASELLTAVHARSRSTPTCANVSHRSAASSGSSARFPPSSSTRCTASAFPAFGFLTENKRVYPNGPEVSHVIGHVNVDNQGIAGIEKWLDGRGLADLHRAGFASDRQQEPVELSLDLRVQHAMRDELIAARDKFKAKAAAGIITDVRTGEIIVDGVDPRLRPQQSARGARSDAHQPADHRRLRDGLDLQGADHRHGTRFRQGHAQLDVRCAPAAALRQVQHSRLSRAEPRAERAGNLHLFLEHRRRARRAAARRRGATRRSCASSASSTGCVPNCRKAPSRSCPSAGAS